jgi:hypothetical protein
LHHPDFHSRRIRSTRPRLHQDLAASSSRPEFRDAKLISPRRRPNQVGLRRLPSLLPPSVVSVVLIQNWLGVNACAVRWYRYRGCSCWRTVARTGGILPSRTLDRNASKIVDGLKTRLNIGALFRRRVACKFGTTASGAHLTKCPTLHLELGFNGPYRLAASVTGADEVLSASSTIIRSCS